MIMIATLNDLLLEKWLRDRESEKLVWETKNGDKIPIKRLSDSHLTNIINYIIKVEDKRAEAEEAYYEGLGGDWMG